MSCRENMNECGNMNDRYNMSDRSSMNGRNGMRPCRRDLLNAINEASFAVDDVKLFLDTHPANQEAMEFFQENVRKRNQLLEEYSRFYGPLIVDFADMSCTDRWNWIQEPWPWQEGGC